MSETPNKKNDGIINLEDTSDDDDDKTSSAGKTVNSSPFAKYNKPSPTAAAMKDFGQIFLINPKPVSNGDNDTVPLRGVVISCAGKKYEYLFNQPVWNQTDAEWLIVTGVCRKPFELKVDGAVVKQTNPQYSRKMLVWILNDEMEDFTEETAKEVYNHYFQSYIQNDPMKKFRDVPPLHPTDGFKILPTWHKTITLKDLSVILQNTDHLMKYAGIKSFFKFSPNNLYSYWPVGEVPIADIKDFKLRKVLLPDDTTRYNEHIASHAEIKQEPQVVPSPFSSNTPNKGVTNVRSSASNSQRNLNNDFNNLTNSEESNEKNTVQSSDSDVSLKLTNDIHSLYTRTSNFYFPTCRLRVIPNHETPKNKSRPNKLILRVLLLPTR